MTIKEAAKELAEKHNPKTRSEVEKVTDALPFHSSRAYIEKYGDLDQVEIQLELGRVTRKAYFSEKPRGDWFRS